MPDNLSDFNEIWNLSKDLHESLSSIKFDVNRSGRSRADTLRIDGRADKTKLATVRSPV